MAIDIYNVTAVLSRTNFDTQSQSVVFTAQGLLYPGGPGEILQLPLGEASSEYPSFMTVYNLIIDGRKVNTGLTLPKVGSELAITGLDDSSALYDGTWRLIADPEAYTGGEDFDDIDSVQMKLVRI